MIWAKFQPAKDQKLRTQSFFQSLHVASFRARLPANLIICTIMSQSSTGRTARLRPITLQLALPADNACYSLGLWNARISTASSINNDSIDITAGASLPIIPSVASWARKVVEVVVRRGIRSRRHVCGPGAFTRKSQFLCPTDCYSYNSSCHSTR